MKYIMGDSLLINSYERFYKYSMFPGFWLWLGNNSKQPDGKILIPHCAYKGLVNTEGLKSWAKKYIQHNMFDERYHSELNTNLQNVIDYLTKGITTYKSSSKTRWMHGMINPYLVAIAKTNNDIIVTNDENSEHNTFNNNGYIKKLYNTPKSTLNDKQLNGGDIRMPDITDHFNVPCINLFDLEDRLGLKL